MLCDVLSWTNYIITNRDETHSVTGAPHNAAAAPPETLASYSSTHNMRRFKSMDLGKLEGEMSETTREQLQNRSIISLLVWITIWKFRCCLFRNDTTCLLEKPHINRILTVVSTGKLHDDMASQAELGSHGIEGWLPYHGLMANQARDSSTPHLHPFIDLSQVHNNTIKGTSNTMSEFYRFLSQLNILLANSC